MNRISRSFSVIGCLLLVVACGGPDPSRSGGVGYQEYECPAPIGRIVREDCSRSALQYEGTNFSGSVGAAGFGASASYKEDAIRQADALVAMLKEQRVGLCNDFNTCKLGVGEYRVEKRQLDDSFVALLALKDKMAQLDAEGAAKLLAELRQIRSGVTKGAPDPSESRTVGSAVSGKWSWTCCDQKYSGDLILQQDGARVTGLMLEPNGSSTAMDGELDGSRLRLTRQMSCRDPQVYQLLLSSDGKVLEGAFSGCHDQKVGVEFKAARK